MTFPGKKILSRYNLIKLFFIILGVYILARAVYTMTVKYEYWATASRNIEKKGQEDPAQRGNILADNGEVLAATIPEYLMFMDFLTWEKDSAARVKDQYRKDTLLQNNIDSICRGIHEIIPEIDPVEFKELLEKGRHDPKRAHHYPLYKKRITYMQYCQVRKLPVFKESSGIGGFHTEKSMRRKNPYGDLGHRFIGDFYPKDDVARSGIELCMDSILRGRAGVFHRVKMLGERLKITDTVPQNGYHIKTTMNIELQDIVEKNLRDGLIKDNGRYGICILMDVPTGDVKAMTTLTRESPGVYTNQQNLATTQLMEPGSVFKPMSFLVAFDDGYIKMTDSVDVGNGQKKWYTATMKDVSKGGGWYSIPKILQKSSNVGVSTVIHKYYQNQPQKFLDGLKRIGITEDLHIPFIGVAKNKDDKTIYISENKLPRFSSPSDKLWSVLSIPWMSIGYASQIPPISTLTFYNGVANNGKMVRPRFYTQILSDTEVIEENPIVTVREHMAKPEAIKNIQDCLQSVVAKGTGQRAASKHFSVSGKTGTAQIWEGGHKTGAFLVTFVGYFPSEAPKYSMIVCMRKDNGPAGGAINCAPIFKKIAESIMSRRISNDYSTACDSTNNRQPVISRGNNTITALTLEKLGIGHQFHFPDDRNQAMWGENFFENGSVSLPVGESKIDVMPDVTGYGLRDAVFRLESMGLKVKREGVGYVKSQSIPAGKSVKRGETVTLHLAVVRGKKEKIVAIRPENPTEGQDAPKTPKDSADKKKPVAAETPKKPAEKKRG